MVAQRKRKATQGLTVSGYARRCGVNVGAAQNWQRTGKLVFFDDGSVNPEASDIRRYENTQPGRLKQADPRGELKPVPAAVVGEVREVAAGDDGAPMTFLEARTANEVLKSRERKLRVAKLKGSLVARATVEAQVSEFVARFKSAALAFPARNGPLLAGEFGLDEHAIVSRLDVMVDELLQEVADAAFVTT